MQPENTPHEPAARQPGEEPTFGDLIRFLWGRRVRLVTIFLVSAGIFGVGLLLWRFVIARTVIEGTLDLSFRGIERYEYPSGKKFSIEDIRSPQVLARARANAGLPSSTAVQDLYVGVEITPVIPSEVQARWRKQDRDGVKREEFFPREFRIRVHPKGLTNDQSAQLLTALVKAYQDEVKFEQESALRRVSDFSTLSLADLIKSYDSWDLPMLFREREAAFRQQIETLTKESHDFQDPRFGFSFRDIAADLATWRDTRLEALTAFIYKGRFVRDRDLMMKRLQQRIDELDVQVRQITGEAEQSTKLLEALDRSKPLLAGPLTNRDGAPLVDSTALEKLVRSDNVGPVVKRVTELHKQAKELEAEKSRAERGLAMLSKPESASARPASGLEEIVALVTKDLSRIVGNYNRLLDEYLNATVTSVVTLKEGPRIARDGPALATLAAVFLCLAAVIPFVVVLFEKAYRET
jgi:hypothetical protein